MARRRLPPVHPGEILKEEFLDPLDLSQSRLATETGLSERRVSEIVQGKRPITADAALRLGRYFRTTAEFWLNMQTHYELEVARDRVGADIEDEVAPLRR